MDIHKQVRLERSRNHTPQRISARSGDVQATQSVARFVLSLLRDEAALAQPTPATDVPRVQRTPTPTERDVQPVRRLAVHDVLRSQGSPLTQPVRAEMEARLGADFSTVRIHTDSTARHSADELGARAYTVGEDVVIGAGGMARHVLAHELTHVIQQRQGPVDGTPQADGLSISDPSDRFEREAERNAVRAMRGTVDVQQATGLTGALAGHVVQRHKRKYDGTGGAPPAKKPKKDKDPESWPRPNFTNDTKKRHKAQKADPSNPAHGGGKDWDGRHIVSYQTMRDNLKKWVDTNYPLGDPKHDEMRDKYQEKLKDINSKIENLPLGEGDVNSALGRTVDKFDVVQQRIDGTFVDSKTGKVDPAMNPSDAFSKSSGYGKHADEFANPIMKAADDIEDLGERQKFLDDVKFNADFDWPGGTKEQFEEWSDAHRQFVDIGRNPGDYTPGDIDAMIDRFMGLGGPSGSHPSVRDWKNRRG